MVGKTLDRHIRICEYSLVDNALRAFKAEIFQALAHPTRVAIVEKLRLAPHSTGQLQEALGLEQANVSQHLAVLRAKQIVSNRKEGNQVIYALADPVLGEVLDRLRSYFYARLERSASLLGEIQQEGVRAEKAGSLRPAS